MNKLIPLIALVLLGCAPAMHAPKALSPENQKIAADIGTTIEDNWLYMKTEKDNEPQELIVRIKMNMDGSLRTVRIVKSSGNKRFDESLLRAVKKSKLPIPPEKRAFFSDMELVFGQ